MNIKYKLHKLPQGFIITSGDDFHNDNLVPNDFAYHRGTKEVLQVISKNNETGSWLCNDGTNRDCYKLFKVIAQQDQIDFSVLKEEEQKEIGWFDVEKLALLKYGEGKSISTISEREGFIEGFQKAQELLSDRRFTLEDVQLAFAKGADYTTKPYPQNVQFENEYKQSLSQQSWKVELEMEDKIALDGHTIIGKEPKLTDGKIKILKLCL